VRTSCRLYDEGNDSEGIRIATSLRVLFHDKVSSSTSIMTHLGRKNALKMLSSKFLPEYKVGEHTAFINIQISLTSSPPIRSLPRLGDKFVELPFADWWSQVVFKHKGKDFGRKDLVLTAVNKDGGAHIDENVADFYTALEAGASLMSINLSNLQFTAPVPYEQSVEHRAVKLHTAILRQFGHEVLESDKHFAWGI
jgi:hypothetical protein